MHYFSHAYILSICDSVICNKSGHPCLSKLRLLLHFVSIWVYKQKLLYSINNFVDCVMSEEVENDVDRVSMNFPGKLFPASQIHCAANEACPTFNYNLVTFIGWGLIRAQEDAISKVSPAKTSGRRNCSVEYKFCWSTCILTQSSTNRESG